MTKFSKNRLVIILSSSVGHNSSLGNQLFQISYGLHLKINKKMNIQFRRNRKKNGRHSTVDTDDCLDFARSLLINNEFREQNTLNICLFRLNRFVEILFEKIGSRINKSEELAKLNRNVEGYFQDYCFAESIRPELTSRLKQSNLASKIQTRKLNQIAIHMRFGDYVDNPRFSSIYGTPSIDYYSKAIILLIDILETDNLVLITDSYDRARTLISRSTLGEFNFDYAEDSSSLEHFSILMSSKGVVLANSTFSWWGAWMGGCISPNEVVYPKPWYKEVRYDSSGLEVPSWHALPSGISQFEVS
jgi:hypothetical protein